MRMFNADGSEGKMCGNAIRCVGKYLYDHHMVDKTTVTVETLSGIKTLELFLKDGLVDSARVNMGTAILEPSRIPVNLPGDRVAAVPVSIGGTDYSITCVSMGNPHCVVFGGDPYRLDLEKIGPVFENDPLFPEQVNTEFIQVLDGRTLRMRVWEREVGKPGPAEPAPARRQWRRC